MKGEMRDTVVWALLLLSFVYAYKAFAKPPVKDQITLQKAYHHTNGKAPADTLLEEGTAIFYFSQKALPIILRKQLLQSGWQECEFFFKNVVASDEVRATLGEFISTSPYYAVSLTQVKRPEVGIIFTLRYDPSHITFSYGSIFSISAMHGLVFRFINNRVKESLAQEAASKRVSCLAFNTVPTIVIDAGHGGTDMGAVAANEIKEKELCLDLVQLVQTELRDTGYRIHLTRAQDQTLSLAERTKIANGNKATLFVSIHANAAPHSSTARGAETFYPDHSAIHYLYSTFAGGDLAVIEAHSRSQDELSKKCAQIVQQELHKTIEDAQGITIHNRGVKPATSQILLGAHVPAILIEVGFLTHAQEAHFLSSSDYRMLIAQTIARALRKCLEQIVQC